MDVVVNLLTKNTAFLIRQELCSHLHPEPLAHHW